ncbi:non-ribosomal peptide synthase [Cylindrospermum sp. NIES-4074]|nr:non-ribosomal peptide synthase [Cylindrospermum sp. NIES-4074]
MSNLTNRIAELSPEKRALLLQRLNQKKSQVAEIQIAPQLPKNQSIPLSFAQQRLWFLEQFDPGQATYNISSAVRLRGKLNAIALEQSLNAVIERHEALRTAFTTIDGQPVQIITPSLRLAIPLIDLQKLPEIEHQQAVQRLATENAKTPFDLSQAPLLRVSLLQLSTTGYVLLLTMHHIISDGWSMGILIQEVASCYQAFCGGKELSLPKLPIQYADFAIWQRQWLQGEAQTTQIAYWRQQLQGSLPVLDLPTDKPRPAEQTFCGAWETFVLSEELSESLRQLSQKQGVTLFMTLLTAFNILLYCYTGQEDILIGSPIANRNRTEIEGLIGFFVNTLVLRTDISGNPSFRELLQRVRQVALDAYVHQDLPFERLVEELQPERHLSHSPLFQVLFNLQNERSLDLSLPDLKLQPLEADTGTAKFDLTLSIINGEREITGAFEYNTDLFKRATIQRAIAHFQNLLLGIVSNPDQHLSELPLLTPIERHQLLVEWNNTQVDYLHNKCIHQLFEEQAERTPDAIAVVFEDQTLTYQELNQKANQLAHHLQKLGVEPEVLVGIYVERSLDLVIGLLAILKAGGAYLPLDPRYPQERLTFMLEDSQTPILLSQQHLVESLPACKAQIICLDSKWELISHESIENPVCNLTPNQLAYVIYTSGSTGRPKGAMIEHQGLVNYLNWCIQAYAVADGCGSPVNSSIGFDATITSLFSPLLVGQKVVLLEEEQEIEALSKALSSQSRFSLVKITPAHLEILQQLLPSNQKAGQTKALIIGGEALLGKNLSFWRNYAPDTRLINEYGPTETVVGCCIYEVSEQTSLSGIIPIGRPIANTQLYILNQYLKPVPIGVIGELYIGGAGVARGYLNRPELTAEKFIANPFSNISGDRLYKTGDLVRYLPNGDIEYIGRIDNQVKLRGFRIELGEIESVLSQHPDVREAVVLVREDRPGYKRLVAYVVLTPATSLQNFRANDLQSFLKEKLPDYMVPSAFVLLEALPLTPNGKVDRRSLPIPEIPTIDQEDNFAAPQTPIEIALAQIWAEVLGLPAVGIHNNFFELGGDSIISLQIIAKANQVGLRLTPKQLFQHQTIAQLATVVNTTTFSQAEQGLVTGAVPLTPIQHWFFEQNLLDSHHWNQSVLLGVRQKINSVCLEQAVQHLLKHHDALRLRYSKESDSPRPFGAASPTETLCDRIQQVNASPDSTPCFSCIDLSNVPTAEQSAAIESAANSLQASLNLSEGPLLRVALFELGADKPSRLLIIVHHLVVDGVSWRILLEDLQTAYQQLSQEENIKLPAKTTSFQQWANRLVEYAQSTTLHSELDYWLSTLQKPVACLPQDILAGTNILGSAATVSVSLSVAETKALLSEVPAVYNTQINEVLLTALALTCQQWRGETSLLIDLEGHGREELFEDVNLSRTVGWFTSIFPVRLDLGNTTTNPGEALKAIKEQLRQIPSGGIGYGILRYLSQDSTIIEQLKALPQAEISFNYLGQFDQVLSESSLFASATESSGTNYSLRDRRSYLLQINGSVIGGQLQLNWQYSEAVHRHSTIATLAQGFIEALRLLIAHCQSPDAVSYTSSDFTDVDLSQAQLDKVLAELDFD